MATRTISTKLAIEGESEYRAAVSRVNAEIKTLQSNLKLTESQFQTNANSIEALQAKHDALSAVFEAQKGKVDTLRSALENARQAQNEYSAKCEELRSRIQSNNEAIEKLRSSTGDTSKEQKSLTTETEKLKKELAEEETKLNAAEKGVNSWQTQLNNAQIKLNDLDAELQKNDRYLEEAKASSDGCAKSIDEFGNQVKESSEATEKQNAALDALASALAAGGIVAGIDKIKDALLACVAASEEFEAGMSAVGAIANASSEEMGLLSEKAKQIGASTMFTAGQAAEALQYMALAGWSSEEMLSGVDGVITLAAASGENLATVSDIVTDALTAFGLKAEDSTHFVDVLAQTAANSNTTVTMLGEAFKYAAPLAGALGYSVEDVAVAMGLMANNGIKGSQAGTTLRTMFSKLAGEVTLSADAFGEVTVTAANADGTMKPFSETLDELRGYFGQMTEAERLANAEALAGKYAMSGLTAIMNTTQEDFDTLTRSISDCTGAAQKMADVRMDNLQGQVTLMKSAFDALKIAVGDDLNPAMRGLAETGTDVLTWAGNFVEKHEAIVPIVASVVAGLTTLTGVLAAFTVGTKVAIPLITAFGAALEANPIGLVVTAVLTLTAAITTFNSLLDKDSLPTVKTFTEAARGLSDSMGEINTKFEGSVEATEATAEQASHYVKILEELETAGLDSAESQEAYRQTVEKLNAIMPELNLTIDEQTGLVSIGTEAINAQIDAWKELAIQEALQSQYKETLSAVAEVEAEQYRNRVKLNEAQAEGAILTAELEEKQRQMAEIQQQMNKLVDTGATRTKEGRDAYTDLLYELETLEGEYYSLDDELVLNRGLQEDLTAAIDIGTQVISENETKLDEATEAIRLFGEQSTVTESKISAEETAVGIISGKLDELAQSYADAYNAAHDSISGMFDLWEHAPTVAAKSIDDMIQAQESQGVWLSTYGELFDDLMSRNIEGIELLGETVSDVSPESAAALMAFKNASDEQLQELINTIQQTKGEEDTLSEKIATVKTDVEGQLAELKKEYAEAVVEIGGAGADVNFTPFIDAVKSAFENVGAQFETIGTDATNGYKNGIEIGTDAVLIAVDALGKGVIGALKTALDSHSPSRETEKIGADSDAGLAQGINENADLVTDAAEDLGANLISIMDGAARDAVDAFDSEFLTIESRVREHLEETRQVVDEYRWQLAGDMHDIGAQMVGGMVDGLYGESGFLYSAIRSIVNNAIEEARAAADTHSPSKKTEKIFEDVGEGMVVGVEKKKERVAEATQGVVDSALRINTPGTAEIAALINASIPNFESLLSSRSPSTYQSISTSSGRGTDQMAGGVVIENLTIEARTMREFRDLVRILESAQVEGRMK